MDQLRNNQGGVFPGKVGRIFPGSLELLGEVLSKNRALLSRFWDMTKNKALLLRFYIQGMKYWRKILHWKQILGKKLYIIGRNFLSKEQRNFRSQEEISCNSKTLPVTGKNFLSQESISCHRKNFHLLDRMKREPSKLSFMDD